MTESAPRERENTVSWTSRASVVVLASLAAWTVFAVPYLPTNDGPQHILSGVMQNHYWAPNTVYRDFLVVQSQFAEHGFSLLFRPLEALFGFRKATQIFLASTVELTGFASLFFASSVDQARRPLGLFGFGLAFFWPLYMGFFAFSITSALGLVVLGVALRRRDRAIRSLVVIGALLALQAFMHVVAAAFTGIALAIVAVARSPRPRSLRSVSWLPLVGAIPMGVLIAGVGAHSDMEQSDLPLRWASVGERLATLPHLVAPGPTARAVVAVALVVVVYVYAALRAVRKALTREEIAVLLVGCTFLFASCVSPIDLPGWQFFAPRWLVLGVLVTPSLVPFELLTRTSRARATLAVVACAASSLLVTRAFHERLYHDCFPIFGQLEAPVAAARLEMPIALGASCGVADDPTKSEVPYLSPLFHAGALFAAAHQAYQPQLFLGSASTYAFREKTSAEGGKAVPPHLGRDDLALGTSGRFMTDAAFHDEVLAGVGAYGRGYDRVVAIGASAADADALLAFGYVPEVRTSQLLLARFRGCAVRVKLPTGHGAVHIEHGVRPIPVALGARSVGAKTDDVELAGLMCGAGWARITVAGETPDAPPRPLCRGAASDGLVETTIAPGGDVVCAPR